MKNKIQAVVKINGVDSLYFYDDEITKLISDSVKLKLEKSGKEVVSIKTELNTPPLTYNQLSKK